MDARPDNRRIRLGLAISLGLHGLLLAALIWSARQTIPIPDAAVDAISVEIVAAPDGPVAPPDRAEPRPGEPAPTPDPALIPPAPPRDPPTAPAGPPGWIVARQMLSAAKFAEPRNKAVYQHIVAMPAYLRDEQLCDFEALEQIARMLPKSRPDLVIAYAFGDTRDESGTLVAETAAYRSQRLWYRLSFRCRVARGRPVVEAFEFILGAPIPRRFWADHGLTADDAD